MFGGMQDWKMRVTHLIDHAAREHGAREIVSRWADGSETRTNWAGIRRDALKMTQALRAAGIKPGDRIATFAMNHSRHLVSWYGAVGVGGVLHTINPRLFDEQLIYIANHAEDQVLLYDAAFQPIIDRLKPQWTSIKQYICYDAPGGFEEWIARFDGETNWHDGDERDPCMLCYTSGTTGNPKGVLYEHRSTMLHAWAGLQPSAFDFSTQSVMLPIVPMFHAASWGLPWAGAAAGAKFVYSAVNDPVVLHELMIREGVTHSAGVPTVWLGMFAHLDATGVDLGKLRLAIIGGSAAPRAMVERLMKAGIRVGHAWGMTETSPIGTMGAPTANWEELSFDEQVDHVCKQGSPPFGVELRVQDLNDDAVTLPRDGVTSGRLQIRGPWIIKRYFQAGEDAAADDGWFDTGDVATIHPNGTLQLTDRTKDVIKSGGEWISSVELENTAVGCPGVAEAGAIGLYHPKWDERPILIVVKKSGAVLSEDDVKAYLSDKIAKWWMPDKVIFADDLPHTATGKILKTELRVRYKDVKLDA
ncbi:MAG: long-chain fatty acid--CoA ligase [Sphingomonadaceae bacterium]